MSCAIISLPMAHQWRTRVCAITIGALGKTNGAKRAPLGFVQWSANGTMALFSWSLRSQSFGATVPVVAAAEKLSNGVATTRRLP
jgi:hypothetical protein